MRHVSVAHGGVSEVETYPVIAQHLTVPDEPTLEPVPPRAKSAGVSSAASSKVVTHHLLACSTPRLARPYTVDRSCVRGTLRGAWCNRCVS